MVANDVRRMVLKLIAGALMLWRGGWKDKRAKPLGPSPSKIEQAERAERP